MLPLTIAFTLFAQTSPVEAQPFLAQTRRLSETLSFLGAPLPNSAQTALKRAEGQPDAKAVQTITQAMDPLCFAIVNVSPTGAVTVTKGTAGLQLLEQGWRMVLVKVVNRAGADTTLRIRSPQAGQLPEAPASEVGRRRLEILPVDVRPSQANLSGLALEYRAFQVFSSKPGRFAADLQFNVGRWSQPTGSALSRPSGPKIREWTFERGSDGWMAMNQTRIQGNRGVLRVESTGSDPYIGTEVRADGGWMVLRMRVKTESDAVGQIFWWTEDKPQADGGRFQNFQVLRTSGSWTDIAVPIKVVGKLKGVRIDTGSEKAIWQFASIRLDHVDAASTRWVGLPVSTNTVAAAPVRFRVLDDKGKPTIASFVIRDNLGRVYPTQSKRLAPDLFFHAQVYRADGEVVRLPVGTYTVLCRRGPESVPESRTLSVSAKGAQFPYRVKRWVDPAARGWVSGDHHIHAAGCQHYTNPTEGVRPQDMIRHTMGEDLKIGANLTWGPGFDYQKLFFTGKEDATSRRPYILRYDIEVSGFGSHQSGHLCLLRLQNQMYPGGTSKLHWPTLGLNTLRWAKKQGAVCGPAHSGSGLEQTVGALPYPDGPNGLPHYRIPAYNAIGANEYVMNIAHDLPGPRGNPVPAIDFISTMNTDRITELNMWYHTLNAGFRVRASGETDFPCMTGERVGLGRVYVKQKPGAGYDDWCEGIAQGRSYVSDGKTHLMDAKITAAGSQLVLGENRSELKIPSAQEVSVSVVVAALADGKPVKVELVQNGYPVAEKMVTGDGKSVPVTFKTRIAKSSWLAVRIFPGAHTNPFFVLVGDKPIRADYRSVEWLQKGLEQCWIQKRPTYKPAEMPQAEADYAHARTVFLKRLEECDRP